jgi:ATP-dependent RNA helicase RhlE
MPYNNTRGRSAFGARPARFGSGAPAARYNGRSFGPAPRKGGRKKEYIDPSKFIKAARAVEVEEYVPTNTFAQFAVEPLLHENIVKKGFVTPSPIQDQAIPEGLKGHDIIGIANTGTGKTVAFAVPMLDKLISNPASSALIMAPTRELALQIQEECKMLARGSGLMGALLIGGAPMMPQLRDLKNKPSVVIGTPGRIKDHLERGSLDLSKFDVVVLDEVDRMLDMGFVGDMRLILAKLAEKRQSFFFSATMDPKVRALINDFSTDPVMISVKTGDTSDNVEQNVVVYTPGGEKIEKLHDILMSGTAPKVLIFDDTQRAVERLSDTLQDRGFKADSIHGGKNQNQRQRALDKFKSNQTNILVATDVAARGIDVSDITHVINYSTPQSYSDYVHRIGRAGRAGRTGMALTFIEK